MPEPLIKLKEIIKAKGDVRVENINKKIEILSDELDYSKKTEQIIFNKNVEIKFEDNFIFNTNKAVYNKFKDDININNFSSLKDRYGNIITSENFKFLIDKKLLKVNSVKMVDRLKNKYFFENALVNFNSNELIGDGIKIDFFKNSFGNSENDPRLRGNYIYNNDNLKKAFLLHAKKMMKNVLLGNLKLKKSNMIRIKKLYIIKMLG